MVRNLNTRGAEHCPGGSLVFRYGNWVCDECYKPMEAHFNPRPDRGADLLLVEINKRLDALNQLDMDMRRSRAILTVGSILMLVCVIGLYCLYYNAPTGGR